MIDDNISPVFIHSLFRSGSTYLFNVFRGSDVGYWCYQEPLNEHLLHAETEPDKLLEMQRDSQKYLRHPELNKPYFYEFHTISDEVRQSFRKELCYDQYFSTEDDDCSELKNYFVALLNGAEGRPVFQCCRTTGRVALIKAGIGGEHIFLWRNPWDQWWSYKLDIYFDRANLFIINSPSAPSFIRKLRDDLGIETFHSTDFWEEHEKISDKRLNASESYMLFYTLWCHAMLEAMPNCDVVINIDRLAVSHSYRDEVVSSLVDIKVKGIDLSGCATPIGVYGKNDSIFFKSIEDEVHELLLCNGYTQIQMDEMLSLRREYSVSPDEIKNIVETTTRDAERARALTRQFEAELAQGYQDIRGAQVRVERAEKRTKHIERELQAVTESRSWRVTAPLRSFLNLFRNMLK